MCTLSIKPIPYPGPGKAFSAVADVSRGTSLGDNRAGRGSALERPGLEVARQLPVRKHRGSVHGGSLRGWGIASFPIFL